MLSTTEVEAAGGDAAGGGGEADVMIGEPPPFLGPLEYVAARVMALKVVFRGSVVPVPTLALALVVGTLVLSVGVLEIAEPVSANKAE